MMEVVIGKLRHFVNLARHTRIESLIRMSSICALHTQELFLFFLFVNDIDIYTCTLCTVVLPKVISYFQLYLFIIGTY